MSEQVLLAADPHKHSVTVAVIDPTTQVAFQHCRFDNNRDGWRQLRRFARRWPSRQWAVEGCNGVGRSLAQRLVADG